MRSDLLDEGQRVVSALQAYEAQVDHLLNVFDDEEKSVFQNLVYKPHRQYRRFEARGNILNYYPFLFADLFSDVPQADIQRVALAGRLALDVTLCNDQLADCDSQTDVHLVLRVNMVLQQVMHLMHPLFPPESTFWHYANQNFYEYAQAVLRERLQRQHWLAPYPEEEMKQVATGRSAIAKNSAAALAVLGGQEAFLPSLNASQDNFAVALQLNDDVHDWRDDLRQQRYSYLLTTAIHCDEKLRLAVETNDPQAEKAAANYLYGSGAFEEALLKAQAYCDQALADVEGLSCQSWKMVVIGKHTSISSHLSELARVKHRSVHIVRDGKRDKKPGLGKQSQAIARARSFLELSQNQEGYWVDYQTEAGKSTQWITGYVGRILAQAGGDARRLQTARKQLMMTQNSEGGWAYHTASPSDADSIANCLLFLAQHGGETAVACHKSAELLAAHWREDGGVATYAIAKSLAEYLQFSPVTDSQKITDYGGWCSSHPEITALVVQSLIVYDQHQYDELIRRGINYLQLCQLPAGYWESYWVHGRIYGTIQAIIALEQGGQGADVRASVQRARAWLLDIQQQDGGWGDGLGGASQPFYTGLAVLALAGSPMPDIQLAVRRGIDWLLARQLRDGSWAATSCLRIPHPAEREPWRQTSWVTGASGLNALVADRYRLLSTATILQALHITDQEKVPSAMPFSTVAENGSDSAVPENTSRLIYADFWEAIVAKEPGERNRNITENYLQRHQEALQTLGHDPRSPTFLEFLASCNSSSRLDLCQNEVSDTVQTVLASCRNVLPCSLPVEVILYYGCGDQRLVVRRCDEKIHIGIALEWGKPSGFGDNSMKDSMSPGNGNAWLSSLIAEGYCRALYPEQEQMSMAEWLAAQGCALAFAATLQKSAPAAGLLRVEPMTLRWCDQNFWFLWNLVRGWLNRPVPEPLARHLFVAEQPWRGWPVGCGRYLGLRMVHSYGHRFGLENWPALLQMPAWRLIKQSGFPDALVSLPELFKM